ncbi:MAG: elongation factor 1-beta [Candidatus Bathyarchaeia archaeon]
MAKVLASIKCFPEDIIIPLETIKESIKKNLPSFASIYRVDEEPIAFGLAALIVHVIIPDSGGNELEQVETALKRIKGVSEVETLLVRRVSF